MPINDTGWNPIVGITGDGEQQAAGRVEMAKGLEPHPCFACRSWEHDRKRIIEHFMAHGLVPDVDGNFLTPIAKDFPGRRSLKLDPKDYGFCRLDCIATDMQATCKRWAPVKSPSDLQARVRR